MKLLNEFAERNGIFYGWFVLAGVMLVILVVGGSFVNSFGVFLPVICNDFGWSRAAVAAGLSLGVMAFGLPSPLFGLLIPRLGPRRAFMAGNSMAALGMAGMALISEVRHLYFLYIFIGLGAGFGGYIASATVVNNWFIRKRPLAMSLFIACMGFAGFVFPPFTTLLISALGWRMTWLVLSGLTIVVSVLIGGVVLIRNKPEEMGLVPDGPSDQTPSASADKANPSVTKNHQMLSKAMPGPPAATKWLIGLFVAANAFAAGTLSTHLVAYLQDFGFNPITAATTISVMAGCNSIGSLTFGTLALRYHVRVLATVAFIVQLAALSILIFTKNLVLIYIYAGLMGISSGALIAALPTFVGAYFEREKYSRVLGVIFPFQVLAQAAAATIAGIIYDMTTSYASAFAIAAVVSTVGLICASLTRPPGR